MNKMEKESEEMRNVGTVSVIIPVYKAEKYLKCCIDSVLGQTFRDLEVILVDDGSPDNSPAVCDRYAECDRRVRVIHKKNEGVSSARNTGLDEASGEWILFVDSDDWLETTYIERLISGLMDEHSDIVIGGFQITDGEGISGSQIPEKVTYSREAFIRRFWSLFDEGLLSPVWGKLFLRRKITETFRSEMHCGEDLRFNLAYLKNAERISMADIAGYCYFAPPESTAGTTKYKKRNANEFSLYISGVRDLLRMAPMEQRDQAQYNSFVFRGMCGDVKWISRSQSFIEAKKEIKKYLALPDVHIALCARAWKSFNWQFQLIGKLLRLRLVGIAVLCCRWGGG